MVLSGSAADTCETTCTSSETHGSESFQLLRPTPSWVQGLEKSSVLLARDAVVFKTRSWPTPSTGRAVCFASRMEYEGPYNKTSSTLPKPQNCSSARQYGNVGLDLGFRPPG